MAIVQQVTPYNEVSINDLQQSHMGKHMLSEFKGTLGQWDRSIVLQSGATRSIKINAGPRFNTAFTMSTVLPNDGGDGDRDCEARLVADARLVVWSKELLEMVERFTDCSIGGCRDWDHEKLREAFYDAKKLMAKIVSDDDMNQHN